MYLLTEVSTSWQSQMIQYALAPVITGVLSAVVAVMVSRRDIKKLKTEARIRFNQEMDKIQVEALRKMHAPMKYVSKNHNNPNSMFGMVKNSTDKHTVLYKDKGLAFLTEADDFLHSDTGSLFLPQELRNTLYKLRGIVDGIIKLTPGNGNELKIEKSTVVDEINEITSGENNLHKQLHNLLPLNNLANKVG